MSLRNGTALAIILSIAFVVIAVAMRDSLPGFAQDSGTNSAALVDQLVQTQEPGSTSGDASLGQMTTTGIESTDANQTYIWEENSYDDDDEDHDDDHDKKDHEKKDHDKKDHHDDDDDDD